MFENPYGILYYTFIQRHSLSLNFSLPFSTYHIIVNLQDRVIKCRKGLINISQAIYKDSLVFVLKVTEIIYCSFICITPREKRIQRILKSLSKFVFVQMTIT